MNLGAYVCHFTPSPPKLAGIMPGGKGRKSRDTSTRKANVDPANALCLIAILTNSVFGEVSRPLQQS